MKGTRTVLALVLLTGLTFAGLLIARGDQKAGASTFSPAANGLLAAYRYLEARGTPIDLSKAPLGELSIRSPQGDGVWVLGFPWQRPLRDGEIEGLQAHLRAGGSVVVAYSRSQGQLPEKEILEELTFDAPLELDGPPLDPRSWWSWYRDPWVLEPAGDWAESDTVPSGGSKGGKDSAPEIVIPALRGLPLAPARAEVLYTVSDGEINRPAIFSFSLHRGRVVVLPASVLSNAYLTADGHADLLESLRLWLDGPWTFDEYHHGFVSPEVAEAESSGFAWDLFIVHLVLFYVLGLLALTRRFGPAWREGIVSMGSTAAFLRNLGALHGELGHHQAAARLLDERLRELDPSRPDEPVPEVRDDAALVAFFRRLSS